MNNKNIAGEINMMAERDQQVRNTPNAQTEEIERTDKKNREKIKDLVKKHGLISISKFGEKASFNAWLLIQHFPIEEVEFQKMYLEMMKNNPEEVNPKNIAYLSDRIAMHTNAPQRYGTQLKRGAEDEFFAFHKIEDVENVDKLRAEIGLEPLSEYIKMFDHEIKLPEGYIEQTTT